MPTTYSGANSYAGSITIPSDGDTRNAASINPAFEGLADRTTDLKSRLDAIAPGSGASPGLVTNVQRVTSLAALAALTAPTTNQVCIVDDLGLYEFDPASAAAAASPAIIAPSVGSGRWFLLPGGSALNVANGLAGLDASARLTAGLAHYGIVHVNTITTLSGNPTVSTPTFVNILSGTGYASAQLGDIILVFAQMGVTGTAAAVGNGQIRVNDGGIDQIKAEANVYLSMIGTSFSVDYRLFCCHVVGTAGVITPKIQLASPGSNTLTVQTANIWSVQIRP